MSNEIDITHGLENLRDILATQSDTFICRMLPRAVRSTPQGVEYIVVFALQDCSTGCNNKRSCIYCKSYSQELTVTLNYKSVVEYGYWYNPQERYDFAGYVNSTSTQFNGNYYVEQTYDRAISGKITPHSREVRIYQVLHAIHAEVYGANISFTPISARRLYDDLVARQDKRIMNLINASEKYLRSEGTQKKKEDQYEN